MVYALRIDLDVYQALIERAKDEDRTLAAEIRRALRAHLEKGQP